MSDDEVDRDPIEAWLAATGGVTAATSAGPAADADLPEGRGRKVGRRLLLLSVLPWLAAVVLAGAALDGRPRSSAVPAAQFPSPTAPTTDAPADAADGTRTPPLATAEHAAAIVALRATAAADEYIDTAAVESTATAGDVTVVTVRAVRLVRAAGAWGNPEIIRAAVGVRSVDGEAVAVAPPWRLPAPASAVAPLPWVPVDDAQLTAAATATAQGAGYTDITKLVVRRTQALPDVVSISLTATAPGDDDARRHEILSAGDATAVLGASPAHTSVLPIPAEQP